MIDFPSQRQSIITRNKKAQWAIQENRIRDIQVDLTTTPMPQDKFMASMLRQVLHALDKLGVIYTLGGETLVGFAEGNMTKYKFDVYIYVFNISLIKKFILFKMLFSEGLMLKPKRKWGHRRFKMRNLRKKGVQKHPYAIYILPIEQNLDESIVYAGGHKNRYDSKDLNPDHLQKLAVENTIIAVPQELNSFVRKYRRQLLSESYKINLFKFTPASRKHAHKLLRSCCEVLEELGIHYWLDFGTLLGLIRENKIIDWDKDMDLSVRYESEAKMEQMIQALGKLYPIKILPPSIRPDAWKLGKYRTVKAFHQKFGLIRTDPHLDFFTQYRGQYEGKTEPTYRSIIAGVNNEIPASFVDELDTFIFDGHKYAIPNHVEDYLALRYGSDWRTPKQYWHPAYDDESMVKAD
ncbi:MAG: LicD family protein [FCB group bacterium]|nr:LicD family protein [FCB group bacterium]